MNALQTLFMVIGILATLVVVVTIALIAIKHIKDGIEHLHIKHIQKHRFDKPPTAKCYCIDCKKWNKETGRCSKFERWLTADSWFCWDAEPTDRLRKY